MEYLFYYIAMIRLSILPVDVNVVTEYTFHHRRVLFQGLPGSHVDYSGCESLALLFLSSANVSVNTVNCQLISLYKHTCLIQRESKSWYHLRHIQIISIISPFCLFLEFGCFSANRQRPCRIPRPETI